MDLGAYLDLDAYKKFPITGRSVGLRVPKGRVTYRFSYAMRHNEANKMTPPNLLPYASFPEFRQNRQFSKTCFNTFLLRIFIVGWRRGLLRRGLTFCIKCEDLGDVLIVGTSRIHQSKSWYYLGPFQTSKVEFFVKIVFGYIYCLYKKLQFRCFTDSIRRFWCFDVLSVKKHFAYWKKYVISTFVCLSLLFQEKMWFIKIKG